MLYNVRTKIRFLDRICRVEVSFKFERGRELAEEFSLQALCTYI